MGLMDKVNENVKKGLDAVDKVKENENIKKGVNFVDKKIEEEKQKMSEKKEIADKKRIEKKQIALTEKEKNRVKKDFYKHKRNEYSKDAKLADEVYKAYITDMVSRLDKVNGRFLASQTIKMDVMIEQNNEIIRLLRKLTNEEKGNNCPACGTSVDGEAFYCPKCATEL